MAYEDGVFGDDVVVQSLSCVQLFVTPWTAAHQTSLSSTVSQSLLKFMSVESVMLSNCLICCPLLLYLQSFSASGCFPMSHVFSSSGQSIGAVLVYKVFAFLVKF